MHDDGNGFERKKRVPRTAEERSAIVAESYKAGQTVAGVARRHGIVASQLSSWRSAARAKRSGFGRGSQFSEVVIVPGPAVPHDGVEISVGPVVIRLSKSTPATRIVDIAQRLAKEG
jgi:transposase